MKKIAILLTGLLMTACHGILDDIYDEAPSDKTFEEGFHKIDDSGHFIVKLDAREYDTLIYVDIDGERIERIAIPDALTGDWDGTSGTSYQLVEGNRYTFLSTVKTDSQRDAENWDFAVHHFDIKTNGGSAAKTDFASLEEARGVDATAFTFQPDRYSTSQVIVDLRDMMALRIGYQNSYYNPVLSEWVTMDFTSPPPTYAASKRVCLLRLPDGRLYAVRMADYMSPTGTKGFLTIEFLRLS